MIKRKITKMLISTGVIASMLGISPALLSSAQSINTSGTYISNSINANIQKAVLNTTIQLSNGVAHKYDMAVITGENENNYNIITQYGVSGSIPKADLTVVKSGIKNQLIKLNETDHVVHVSTNLNVRLKPDVHAGLLTTLKNGENVQIIGKEGEWFKVNINGQNGFIYNDFIQEGTVGQNKIISNTTSTKSTTSKKEVTKTAVVAQTHNSNKTNENDTHKTTSKENTAKPSVLNKYNIEGTWKITNQAAYPEDTNGKIQVLTGETIVLKPDVFKIGNISINNPTYSTQKVGMDTWFGHPGDVGNILNTNWDMTVLNVNGQSLFSGKSIIIANGKIQVINKESYVYNTEKI